MIGGKRKEVESGDPAGQHSLDQKLRAARTKSKRGVNKTEKLLKQLLWFPLACGTPLKRGVNESWWRVAGT